MCLKWQGERGIVNRGIGVGVAGAGPCNIMVTLARFSCKLLNSCYSCQDCTRTDLRRWKFPGGMPPQPPSCCFKHIYCMCICTSTTPVHHSNSWCWTNWSLLPPGLHEEDQMQIVSEFVAGQDVLFWLDTECVRCMIAFIQECHRDDCITLSCHNEGPSR